MRLTERLTRLEQYRMTRHYLTDEQVRRIAESVAISELLHRSPARLSRAERPDLARAALPHGLGDPDRVVREWLTCRRLAS